MVLLKSALSFLNSGLLTLGLNTQGGNGSQSLIGSSFHPASSREQLGGRIKQCTLRLWLETLEGSQRACQSPSGCYSARQRDDWLETGMLHQGLLRVIYAQALGAPEALQNVGEEGQVSC